MTQIAKLGKTSLDRLGTCHPDLQRIILRAEAISPMDFTVLEGLRSTQRQGELYAQGRTKPGKIVTSVDGQNRRSKHQAVHRITREPVADDHPEACSLAIDLAPYPVNWDRAWAFDVLAGVILTAAHQMGIALRWGGDWDGDWDRSDQRLTDAPHFELL